MKIQAYVVGGWVRDRLLGRDTDDIDIALKGDGLDTAEKLALSLGGKYVPLDEVNRIGRIVLPDAGPSAKGQQTIDIASYQDNIEKDLARRDFTINALAIELSGLVEDKADRIIDPFKGKSDLESKIIRAVAGTAFAEDPVRLLRAVRLAVLLDFTIEPETESMIMWDAALISRVAGERVREEVLLILSSSKAGSCLEYLDMLHLLTALFPELEKSRGFPQPSEHYWDVLNHSLKTVAALDYLLHLENWEYTSEAILAEVPWSDELKFYFEGQVGHASSRIALTRLSALFHDIAKPRTMTVEPGGRVRFLGHADEGIIMIADILARMRFSNREARFVETLVKYHLRPTQMGLPEMPTRRAVYRYYRDTGEAAVGVLFLSLADHLATRGPNLDLENWKMHCQVVAYVLSQRPVEEKRPVRLIDGYDIMNIFGLGPGPQVGELLELVQEAQAAGEVTSKDEALILVKQLIRARSGDYISGDAEQV
jgi:poly(A) polymerase